MRIITAIAMVLFSSVAWLAGSAHSADRSIEIINFSVYPDDIHNFNKLGGYVWPEVTELNALIEVELAGFTREQKLDVFLVVYDEDDRVIHKDKAKHYLPVGEHDVVFARFMTTTEYFGERSFEMEVEVSMKGAKPQKAHGGFSIEGPDPPEVDILDLKLYLLNDDLFETRFRPGSRFSFEAKIEIEENESEIQPTLRLYCAMEEDSFIIGPEFEHQEFYEQRDHSEFSGANGLYRVRANGFLPYFFEETWRYEHPFRVYITVDYGNGIETTDYARGIVYDSYAGDNRYAEDVGDRLIRLDRANSWIIKRVRGGNTGHRYWWD